MKYASSTITLLMCSFICCFTSVSSTADTSFLDVYRQAKEYDTDLALAELALEGARAESDLAMSKILPQMTLFGQWSDNAVRYEPGSSLTDLDYPGQRYGVSVRQPLLSVSSGLEALRMRTRYKVAKVQRDIAEVQMFSALMAAFLDVLSADSEVLQLESELKALNARLVEVEALHEVRLSAFTEVLEARARTESVKADLIRANGTAAVARETISLFTGKRGFEPLPVVADIPLMIRYETAAAAAETAISNSVMLELASFEVTAARQGLDRERARWIPEVDLTYTYQHSDVGFDNLRSPARDTSSIAIGFNYPLFEGGGGRARIKGSRAELGSAQAKLESVRRDVQVTARAAWLNLRAATEQIVAAKEALSAATASVEAVRNVLSTGGATTSDFLVALAAETEARRRLNSANFSYALGWAELELYTGANPAQLATIVSRALHP